MKQFFRLVVASLALLALPAAAGTLLHVRSDPGDYIGRGLTYHLTEADGGVSVSASTFPSPDLVAFQIGGRDSWGGSFQAPNGAAIAMGSYANTIDFPAGAAPSRPAMNVSGMARGCNSSGRFEVLEIEIVNLTITKLAIDFEQHCDGSAAAVYGSFRHESAIPVSSWVLGSQVTSALVEKASPLPLGWSRLGGGSDVSFKVQVSSLQHQPVPIARVKFEVLGGCGTFDDRYASVEVAADVNGIATSPRFRSGAFSGPCVTRASSVDVPSAFVDFETLLLDLDDLVLVPDAQSISVVVNHTFRPSVVVRWQGSRSVPNFPINFVAGYFTGGANALGLPMTVTSDANGRAMVQATANGIPGTYAVVADAAIPFTIIPVTQSAEATQPASVPEAQDMWWGGVAENGWGMSVVKHGEQLFLAIYGYDASSAPTWWVVPGGTWDAAKKVFTAPVYAPHGSPFYAYDASRFVAGAPVGTVTLTFADAGHARLDYTIGAVQGTRQLERLSFALPGPAGVPAGLGRDDMYWGGAAQNGWGISVIRQFSELFAVWYTYDANGAPTWFVMPSGQWGNGSPTYEGRIYRATGSPWLAPNYDVSKFVVTDVGSYRLRFDAGVFEYTVDGRSGSVPLSKIAF